MKIALITANCYPATKAGTEIYVHELANALVRRNIDVIVFTQEAPENAIDLSYRIKKLSHGQNKAEEIFNEKPDIAHFHSLNEGGFTIEDLLNTKQYGVKVIVTFHLANNTCLTNDLWKFRNEKCNGEMQSENCAACYLQTKIDSKTGSIGMVTVQKLVLNLFGSRVEQLPGMTLARVRSHHEKVRRLLQEVDHIICLADWYKKVLELNGVAKDKLSRFPQIQPPVRRLFPDGLFSVQKVIFIGRLNIEKGIYDILQAWKKLNARNLQLHIFGGYADEETRRLLEPEIQSIEGIRYHGAIPHDALLAQLHDFDVMILASRFSEMSPLVIGEAIEFGLPIIGSDSPGVEEACQGGLHAIFPRGNVVRLAQILQKYADGENIFSTPCRKPQYVSSSGLGNLHSSLYRNIAGTNL